VNSLLCAPDATEGSVRQFSPSFYESSEVIGLANRTNGDSVAVSREWFPQAAEGGRGNPTWFENPVAIFVITRERSSLERT
jgi:hypothetical protein